MRVKNNTFKELSNFDHVILLRATNLKIKDLSEDIKVNISDFESRFKEYRINPKQEYLTALDSYSKLIAQHIVDYFVEDEDQTDNADIKDMVADVKNAIDSKKEDEELEKEIVIQVAPSVVNGSFGPNPFSDSLQIGDSDDQALYSLYQKGITQVDLKQLGQAGFKTGFFSKLTYSGCNTKNFILKRINSNCYSLSKK